MRLSVIDAVRLEKYINYLLFVYLVAFASIYYTLWLTHDALLTHDAIMWFGVYNYAVDCLMNGHLPLWDPYGQSGNSFYQNINFLGLLEPISLIYFIWVKFSSSSILYSFIYLHITRIIFMSVGAYLAYQYISGSKLSAKIAATVFFMSLFSTSLHQNGFVSLFMTMPWILYFSLKYLDNIGQEGSAKYLYAAAVALGIAFNMYIPVYTTFYLFVFFVMSILTGAIRLTQLKPLLSRKALKEFSIAIVLLLLLSAVPLSVFLNDLGTKGELYPYLRSYTSNSANLVKQMVSDASGTALSGQYYKEDQISGTFFNLIQLVAPSYWKIRDKLMMTGHFQETLQFIGIVSILIILCTVRFKSRFKYSVLLTTVVIAFAMTATYAWGKTNIWHVVMKNLFPPLKLIKVYESFLGGHLFNLGLLLAMGLSSLENKAEAEPLYERKLFVNRFFVFCLIVYLLSYMFILMEIANTTNMEVFLGNLKNNARLHLQVLLWLIGTLSLLYFVVAIYKRGYISYLGVYCCVTAIILLELTAYNLDAGFRKPRLSPNYLKDDDPIVHHVKPDVYDNFRSIYTPPYFSFVTFQEALLKKGAALPDIFHWKGNVVFTSKRYYELISHVPIENIFVIAGVVSPKARFFEDAYITNDRKEILEKLSAVSADNLNNSLFIEMDKPQDFEQFKKDVPIDGYKGSSPLVEERDPFERIKQVYPTAISFSADNFRKASRRENDIYGFPDDWQIYVLEDIEGTPLSESNIPAGLLTINNSNIGKIVILKENMPAVLLGDVSKTLTPVFLSYGEQTYADPPIEVSTMVDGRIISTKPFDGDVLFDTLERKINDTDKGIKNIFFSPNKVSFSVKNQKPGFFYYADGWSPYWKAYDNGMPTKVLKANYNYKAVFLPPGEHVVTFVFSPYHYMAALVLYFSGLFIGITLAVVLFVRDRRHKRV